MIKLSNKKKFDFITRNGWVADEKTKRYRKKEWDVEVDEFIRQGGDVHQHYYAFRSHTLEEAYELEMEEEYERVILLLKDARELIDRTQQEIYPEGKQWLENYKEWSEIWK